MSLKGLNASLYLSRLRLSVMVAAAVVGESAGPSCEGLLVKQIDGYSVGCTILLEAAETVLVAAPRPIEYWPPIVAK